jgi:cell division protein FtsB
MPAQRRRRWTFLYVATVALLAALAVLDPSGLRKHLRLHDEVRRIAEENRRLAEENGRLAREARALRSDPAALERAAREELRFVRPGEIVYRLDPAPEARP